MKKHLEFDLIDTSGMTESQLREIPYTVVQTTQAKQLKQSKMKQLQWIKEGYVLLTFTIIFFHQEYFNL